jgi:hypothetical protein
VTGWAKKIKPLGYNKAIEAMRKRDARLANRPSIEEIRKRYGPAFGLKTM